MSGTVVSDVSGMYGKPALSDPACDDLANVEMTGKSVKILDADGETVGLAQLVDEGPEGLKFDGHDLQMGFQTVTEGKCIWSFTAEGFASDSDFFTVSVDGVNGDIDFSRADLLAGPSLSVPHGRP